MAELENLVHSFLLGTPFPLVHSSALQNLCPASSICGWSVERPVLRGAVEPPGLPVQHRADANTSPADTYNLGIVSVNGHLQCGCNQHPS